MKNKNLLIFAVVAMVSVFLTSCSEDEGSNAGGIETEDTNAVANEEEVQSIFEDLDELAIDAITEAYDSEGGRLAGTAECAIITFNLEEKVITVDYGVECEGPRGRVRSGKIIISYTGRHAHPGSVITTTFEDFVIDGISIEGTRTVTNLNDEEQDNPSWRVTLDGGKITWPDQSFATREVVRTKTWVRTQSLLTDEFHISGIAEGTTRDGKTYRTEIVEAIVWKVNCAVGGIFIPASGLKEVEISGRDMVSVDYGDGSCDRMVKLSRGDYSIDVNINDVAAND